MAGGRFARFDALPRCAVQVLKVIMLLYVVQIYNVDRRSRWVLRLLPVLLRLLPPLGHIYMKRTSRSRRAVAANE